MIYNNSKNFMIYKLVDCKDFTINDRTTTLSIAIMFLYHTN